MSNLHRKMQMTAGQSISGFTHTSNSKCAPGANGIAFQTQNPHWGLCKGIMFAAISSFILPFAFCSTPLVLYEIGEEKEAIWARQKSE